jgi:hypothetical protein
MLALVSIARPKFDSGQGHVFKASSSVFFEAGIIFSQFRSDLKAFHHPLLIQLDPKKIQFRQETAESLSS